MIREFQLNYLLSFTGMLAVCTAMPEKSRALPGETPTIRRMATGDSIVQNGGSGILQPIAMLTRDSQGTDRLVVREFNRATGIREAADLTVDLTVLMEEEGLVPAP